jgi:hypothetical protein
MITKSMYVKVDNLSEWQDNPEKRSQISDRDLEMSIREEGVKKALDVISLNGNGKFLVVDGNRRLRIAKRNGIKELYANVHDDSDPVKLAVTLNTRIAPWDQQTLGQLVATHKDALHIVPDRYRKMLVAITELLGDDYQDFILNYSPNAFIWGMKVASYVGRKDDRDFCKKAVLWVGKHKLIRLVRQAIELGTPPGDIERAVRLDKPLRFTV